MTLWLLLVLACSDDPTADRDGDGLPDVRERALGTDPDDPDSDGDGKTDGDEVLEFGTDPLKKDTDGDGLADGAELARGTDPLTPEVHALQDDREPVPSVDDRPDDAPDEDAAPRIDPTLDALPEALRCETPGADLACFVAIPETTAWIGAQADDPSAPNHDPDALPTEGPVRQVTVGPLRLQQQEVRAADLRLCLESGWCDEADVGLGAGSTVADPARADHPANLVSWRGAQRYCAWLSGRLPTEAEWEVAARGTDGRRWPWGDTAHCGVSLQDPRRLDRIAPREPPCIHEGPLTMHELYGASPFDVRGQAGNVWEWVDGSVPSPEGGEPLRVQRGGGWSDPDPVDLRASVRQLLPGDQQLPDVGFRCAWVPPRNRR